MSGIDTAIVNFAIVVELVVIVWLSRRASAWRAEAIRLRLEAVKRDTKEIRALLAVRRGDTLSAEAHLSAALERDER